MKLTQSVNLCYNANVAFAKRLPAGRNKMALALTSDAYESKGGDVMSDFEMLSLFCMIVSLVLVAIELGRNIGNQNKK